MMDLQRFSPKLLPSFSSKFSPKLMVLSIMATTGIAAIGLAAQPAFALEKLDDTALAAKTGEGIGFVVEDLKVVADQNAYVRITSAGSSAIPTNATANTKKADIYVYGLSVGATQASNTDTDGFTGNEVAGANIGSVDNPIVFTTKAEQDGINTGVMSIKLPSVAKGSHPANSNAGKNLKAVAWVDVMGRNAATFAPESIADGAAAGSTKYPNYLRMQTMANKFSLNGTEVHFYKTGNFSAGSPITTGVAAFDSAMAAERARMVQAYSNKVANYGKLRLNYETDTNAATKDTLQNSGYFRWSVAHKANPSNPAVALQQGDNPTVANSTNALGRGYGAAVVNTAPVFDSKEGLYVKDFQINMPLGAAHQPVIVDTDENGNLTIEVARIPNIKAIYDKHYIDYSKTQVVNGKTVLNDAQEAKMCRPNSCTEKATHATAYFRTFALNSAGQPNTDYTQAQNGEPFIAYQDRGYGVKGVASGAAGIGTDSITPYAANIAPTYNMAEGLVVNHLKITLNK